VSVIGRAAAPRAAEILYCSAHFWVRIATRAEQAVRASCGFLQNVPVDDCKAGCSDDFGSGGAPGAGTFADHCNGLTP
jgi:hypothetical protein